MPYKSPEKRKAYNALPETKLYNRIYAQTRYAQDPEYRAYMKAYMAIRDRTPERKAYEAARRQNPEYKAYMKAYRKSYYRTSRKEAGL